MKCYRLAFLFTLLLTLLVLIGLIVSELVPRDYLGRTFVYDNSIILMDRINPFYYSTVKVLKDNDKQDHLFLVYLLPCDTTIVERMILSHNATFTTEVNVILLPQDAMFLIDGSLIEISYSISKSTMSSSPSNHNASFVISNDLTTLKFFKENGVAHDTEGIFVASPHSDDFNHLSYDVNNTGYYYIGFSPSGNVTVSIEYKIYGFKYSRPNLAPACTLHKSSDTCTIPVPVSLTYTANEYCLLGEVISEPYYVDTVSIDVTYKVEHHGKWNFITILLVLSLSCLCVLNVCLLSYWCLCHLAKSRTHRVKYVSIQ